METTNHHPCGICGIICLNLDILSAHIKKNHPNLCYYKCHICDQEIKNYCVPKRLETHFVMFHSNQKLRIARIEHDNIEYSLELPEKSSEETVKTAIKNHKVVHYLERSIEPSNNSNIEIPKHPFDTSKISLFGFKKSGITV